MSVCVYADTRHVITYTHVVYINTSRYKEKASPSSDQLSFATRNRPKEKMYCLQVAAYHLFFNASRLCYFLALLIFVFLRFFYIFHYISVVNHVGDSRTAAFLAITDTKQVHGELNVTFSGVFLGSAIQNIATCVF